MKDHQLESYNLSKIIVDYHLHYKHLNSITAVTKVEMLHPQFINCCLHLVSCVGDFIPNQSSLGGPMYSTKYIFNVSPVYLLHGYQMYRGNLKLET